MVNGKSKSKILDDELLEKKISIASSTMDTSEDIPHTCAGFLWAKPCSGRMLSPKQWNPAQNSRASFGRILDALCISLSQ
jgi:hypothetical protein